MKCHIKYPRELQKARVRCSRKLVFMRAYFNYQHFKLFKKRVPMNEILHYHLYSTQHPLKGTLFMISMSIMILYKLINNKSLMFHSFSTSDTTMFFSYTDSSLFVWFTITITKPSSGYKSI